ncbi:glycosyltransferase family protein [Pseudomonas sp. Marseille-QA0892]
MQFSDTSDVTVVLTSCGRFEHLKRTLESFDRFNTAPIKAVIITEDSGSEDVFDAIPTHWRPYTTVHVNRTKLGQLASIDLAYSSVETPYIFHCEDDWEFYRPGFVEDSLSILAAMPDVLQVWLRSYRHDVAVNYPFHSLGERNVIGGCAFSKLLSSKSEWQGFSFNPGLRRLSDYLPMAPFSRFASSPEGESGLSREYSGLGKYAVVLESDAVIHIGDDAHVWGAADDRRVADRKRRRIKRVATFLAVWVFGFAVGYFVTGGL